MPIISNKFYTKYVKITNNIIQLKEYFKTYIFYFKNISNIKS